MLILFPMLLAALPGPPAPPLKGVAPQRSSALPLWHARSIRALAQEAGATVEVEDRLPHFAPILARYRITQNFSFQFRPWLPSSPLEGVPPPTWMNPNVITAGGNTVHQNFTFGATR